MAWTVTVRRPGPRDGKNLSLVMRLSVDGKRVREKRETCGTADARAAELLRAERERALNAQLDTLQGPLVVSCLMPLDARIKALEAEGFPASNSHARLIGARKRLAPHLEAVALDELDRARLLLARDALKVEGRAATTINTTLGALSAAWGWAFDRDLVPRAFPRVRNLKRGPVEKRPYTDSEVVALLAWVLGARAWAHPILSTIADAGRRVSEIITLKGRDVARERLELHLRAKGGRVEVVPLSPEVMALIPETPAGDYVWPLGTGAAWRCKLDPTRHVSRGALLRTVKAGLEAIGVADRERLDVHSLRRAFVASCDRAGVPADVGRRVTGHKTQAMWEHYQAGYAGDNLHEAVAAVRARRYPPLGPAPDPPQNDKAPGSEPQGLEKLAVGLEPTTSSLRSPQDLAPQRVVVAAPGAERGAIVHDDPSGHGDAVRRAIRRAVEWLDQDREAFLVFVDPARGLAALAQSILAEPASQAEKRA